MSEPLSRDLAVLIELFKSDGWREIRIESDAISVLLSTDSSADTPALTDGSIPLSVAHEAVKPLAPAASLPLPPSPPSSAVDARWHAVVAPNLGTFYRSPKPGAAAFVEVGDTVTPDTEICLLEVMKLFTSVKAGVGGVVRRIAARDAELVEGGQILFHIEPQES